MTKAKLVRELWRLVDLHNPKKGPHCKNDCALRGELRGLLKSVNNRTQEKRATE